MLVAPTPAEYRLLGTNERLLAALRGATGGRALETGADAWTHDLGTTTAATDLLPWLLLLALLLWPLDVAIRRVSVSRGDLALARAWTGDAVAVWRGPARRPEQVGGMLAAKERAPVRGPVPRSSGQPQAHPARGRPPKMARPRLAVLPLSRRMHRRPSGRPIRRRCPTSRGRLQARLRPQRPPTATR